MKINDVIDVLDSHGIPCTYTDEYVACEDYIEALNDALRGKLADIAAPIKHNSQNIRNTVEITCEDGIIRGCENEGAFFFEWGLSIDRQVRK